MLIPALDIADDEEADSFLSREETTSPHRFAHLSGTCNILRGPINQDEYKSDVTPAGKQAVKNALRSVVWVKYKIKDKDVFDKAYNYVGMY